MSEPDSRELRLGLTPAEYAYTIELRLMCPANPVHHVGTLRTNAGSGWKLRLSSSSSRGTERRPGTASDASRTEPTSDDVGMFRTMDDDDRHDDGAGDAEIVPPSQSSRPPPWTDSLRWDQHPDSGKTTRLRWTCAHCAADWRRRNARGKPARQDNVIRAEHVIELVRAMREHGPSRLRVELRRVALIELTRQLRVSLPGFDPGRP